MLSFYCMVRAIWKVLSHLISFQVKSAYVHFLNHCYVDTEVEMKEIYSSSHIWTLFEDFMVDMGKVILLFLFTFYSPLLGLVI